MKTAKLSAKNQLTLPAEIAAALGVGRGTELMVVQDGDRIILLKAETVAARELQERQYWTDLMFENLRDVWDNPEDDVFNDL